MSESLQYHLFNTARRLGVVNDECDYVHFLEFCAELAQKNPRVLQVICEADSLRLHVEKGGKFFDA